MKVMLDPGAKMPTRAHSFDAGLDLYAMEKGVIPGCTYSASTTSYSCGEVNVGSRVFDTGVHVEIPEGYVGLIKSKSGLMVNHKITTDGTIDAHYTGSIRVCLFNYSTNKYKVKAGDKIAQLVIVPCVLLPLEVVDSLEETDRGNGGFGSTGR
jgi:dUTP pyrophosphatase